MGNDKPLAVGILVSAHPVDDMRVLHREAISMAEWADVTIFGLRATADITVSDVKTVIVEARQGRMWRLLWAPFLLSARAAGAGTQVLHVHDPEILPAAILVCAMRRLALVFDDHENYPEVMLSKEWLPKILRRPACRAIKLLYRVTARRAALVITPTESLAEGFRALGARAAVVRNFPPKEVFSIAPRDLPDTATREFDVVHLGTISNLRLSAFAKLVVEVEAIRPGTKWRIIGLRDAPSNDFRAALPPQAALNVSFEGPISASQVPSELVRACVGVNWHPDLEQFRTAIPNKVPEYLSMGLPVVTTEIPELAQALPAEKMDEHGVQYADRDISRFAKVVARCIDDARSGVTPSAASISGFAANHLTWEAEAESLRAGYAAALGLQLSPQSEERV